MNTEYRQLTGILLMILAMQIVPMSDAIAKYLTTTLELPVLQIAWARCAFQALWLLPLVLPAWRASATASPAMQRTAAWKLHFLRGALWAGVTGFFFLALRHNPLPNALAVAFVAPLIVAAFAPLLLGEEFNRRRALAIVAGFIGVLIVLRPPAAEFRPSLVFALAAGACYGGYLMTTRQAMRTGGQAPVLIVFYATFTAALCLTPLALADWRFPTAAGWGWILLMGFLSAGGHYLITKACEYAPASLVAPFIYTEIIGACVISALFFRELPSAAAWGGIALIIGAGVYVSLREYRHGRQIVTVTAPP